MSSARAEPLSLASSADMAAAERRALGHLLRLNQVAIRADSVDEIVHEALEVLDAVLKPDRSSVLLFDDAGAMRFRAWRRLSADYRRAVDGHSPWEKDSAEVAPILVADISTDELVAPLRGVIAGEGIGALAFVPLACGGQLLGKFMLYYDAPHAFSEEEVELAQAISGHVAFVVAQKQAETRLRLYRQIFANANEPVAVIDTQGRYVEQNTAHAELTGYDDAALVGKTPAIHLGEETFAAVSAELASKGEVRMQVTSRTRDGIAHDIALSAFTIRDEHGAPRFFVGSKRNITADKRDEHRLRCLAKAGEVLSGATDESVGERLVEVVSQTLADWCVIDLLAPDGTPRRLASGARAPDKRSVLEELRTRYPPVAGSAQPAAEAIRSRAAVVHRQVTDAIIQRTSTSEGHLALLRELAPRSVIAVPLIGSQSVLGAITYVRGESAHPFDDGDVACAQELAGRMATTLDNLRLTRELNAAIRARDEFLSIASHELRTPLTSLQLQLENTLREEARTREDGTLARRMEAAGRQVRRLATLVNDLLEVSRITAGRVTLERETCNLAEIVREVARRFEPDLLRAGCALTIDAPDPVPCTADRLRIDLVISNLLSNACKYGAGKPIQIAAERSGDVARLVVRDHGMGIAPGSLARIFDRFERVVSSRHFGGFGLGLWIVREIVEAHEGTISVESAPGEGARFTVELP